MRETVTNYLETLPVTIDASASLANQVYLGGLRLFALTMPEDWTSADLTFLTSTDGGASWYPLYDKDGSELTITAQASRTIALEPALFAGLSYLQLRSGSSDSAIAQEEERVINLVLRLV